MFSMTALEQMTIMMLLCLVGLTLRKTKVLTDEFLANINRLLILVAQPALMITSTQQEEGAKAIGNFMIAAGIMAAAIMTVMGVMFLLTHRRERKVYSVLCCTAALPNLAYMGIPVAQALLGDKSVFYMCASIVGFNVAQWTLGSLLYGKTEKTDKKQSFNYILPTLAFGIILLIFNIRVPKGILGALQQLSNLNTPLAMLILGARMSGLRLSYLKDWNMWLVVGMKLAVFPLIIYAILSHTSLPPLLISALILGSAMPSAANVQIQAEMKHADTELAARCISVTLLISMFTIPLIMSHIA